MFRFSWIVDKFCRPNANVRSRGARINRRSAIVADVSLLEARTLLSGASPDLTVIPGESAEPAPVVWITPNAVVDLRAGEVPGVAAAADEAPGLAIPPLEISQSPVSTGYLFGIQVRPGQASYPWQFNPTYVDGNNQTSTLQTVAWGNVPGFGWYLDRGKFQYSTDNGAHWNDMSVNNDSNLVYYSISGTLFRFLDQSPNDTTNTDQVGHYFTATAPAFGVGGSGTTISLDLAPTDITVSSSTVLSDATTGTTVATLTPTDTGLTRGGAWVIDSQSVPNLFTLDYNSATGNTATLKVGTGVMPAGTATVTARYCDPYNLDSSGNPINGEGISKTFTINILQNQTNDLTTFGSNIAVNTYTTDRQQYPTTTTLSNGNYVVVWQSEGQNKLSASDHGIYGQLFAPDGTKIGSEFVIANASNTSDHVAPSVAALDNGRFVVAYATDAGSDYDIGVKIVAADGTVGSEVIAHDASSNNEYYPSIATMSDGSFAVAWSVAETADLQLQKFDATGAKSGTQVTVAAGEGQQPAVAGLSNGKYIVSWVSWNTGKVTFQIEGDAPVATAISGWNYVTAPGILPLAGDFVITNDDASQGISAAIYNNDGSQQRAAFSVNTNSNGSRTAPTIAQMSDSGFLIAWSSDTDDGIYHGVFGRRFDADGTALDSQEFQINEFRDRSQEFPDITGLADGAFATVWQVAPNSSGSDYEIETRVFSTASPNPVLTDPGTWTYTENDAATAVAPALTLTDTDSSTMASATVTLTNVVSGQDVLSFTNSGGMGNIVGSYINGVLTMTSAGATATTAQWQTALRAVTYANSSEQPDTTARTIEIVVSDGTNSSNSLTSTITVVAANDAPTLGGAVANQAVNDNATISPFSTFTVTDPDTQAAAAMIDINNGTVRGDFTAASSSGWTRTVVGTTIRYFRNFASAADIGSTIQAAIRSLVFQPRTDAIQPGATEVTSFRVTVGDAVAAPVANSTTSVVSTSVNDSPGITGAAANQTVNDNVTVNPFSTLVISDLDTQNICAQITVSNGVHRGDFTSGSSTGWTRSVVGNDVRYSRYFAPSANIGSVVQTAIRSLVFEPRTNGIQPGTTETTAFRLLINDGITNTSDSTTSVVTTSLNNAPSLSGATVNQAVSSNATVSPFSTLLVNDPDTQDLCAVVTISNGVYRGDFTSASRSGWTRTVTGHDIVYSRYFALTSNIGGTAQAAIRSLVFQPQNTVGQPGTTQTTAFSVLVNDGVTSATDTGTSVVSTKINQSPTVGGTSAQQVTNDDATLSPFSTITVTDGDTQDMLATVTISNGAHRGDFTTASSVGWTRNVVGNDYVYSRYFAPASEIGSVVQIALRSLVFQPRTDAINPGLTEITSFTVLLNDGFGTATDTTSRVSVTSVNNSPVIGGVVADQTVNAGSTIAPFSTLTVSDPDTQDLLVRITITNGVNRGDFTPSSATGWTRLVVGNDYIYNRYFSPGANIGSIAQAAIRGLVFQPRTTVAPATSETTYFTVLTKDGSLTSDTNSLTSVVTAGISSGFTSHKSAPLIGIDDTTTIVLPRFCKALQDRTCDVTYHRPES